MTTATLTLVEPLEDVPTTDAPDEPDTLAAVTGSRSASRAARRGERGAASAEYAAVTACGVGLAGVLMKLLTSDFGQNLLETLIKFFLKMVGIG